MNRTDLKRKLLDERNLCDFCEAELGFSVDMHEWLIKRSAVPKSKKTKLWDERNCSLLHTSCHAKFGQTTRMKEKLAPIFVERYGKPAMLEFVTGLHLRAAEEYINVIKKCHVYYH